MLTALFTTLLGVAQPLPQGVSAAPILSPRVAQAEPKAEPKIDYSERAKKGRFSFDFSKAEIEDIVKAISDMTRRNFIIPENLKGKKITILSPTKISSGEAYSVFLSALAANEIT